MTTKETIEYWEGLRKTFSGQLEKEENYFGRMHLQTTIDALDTTIAALREQEERENPKPLTMDELRHMDGRPVWDNFLMEWCVIMMDLCNGKGAVKYFDGGFNRLSEKRFYSSKPKEDAK